MGMDTLSDFFFFFFFFFFFILAILAKGENICDFLFAFLHIKSLSKMIYSKKKEFAPEAIKRERLVH